MNHVYWCNRAHLQRSKHDWDDSKQGTKKRLWQKRVCGVHRAQGMTMMTQGVKFTGHKARLWWHNPWSSQGTRLNCDTHQWTLNVTCSKTKTTHKKDFDDTHQMESHWKGVLWSFAFLCSPLLYHQWQMAQTAFAKLHPMWVSSLLMSMQLIINISLF